MTASAVLVIQNWQTKLVNVKNQSGLTKVLDMVPELIDKISEIIDSGKEKEEEDAIVDTVIEDVID